MKSTVCLITCSLCGLNWIDKDSLPHSHIRCVWHLLEKRKNGFDGVTAFHTYTNCTCVGWFRFEWRTCITWLCKCSMNKQTNERNERNGMNCCITVHNYMKHGGEKLKPSKDTMWECMKCTLMCALHTRKKPFPRAHIHMDVCETPNQLITYSWNWFSVP